MQTINIQRAIIGALSVLVFQTLGACGDSGGSDGGGGAGASGGGLPSTSSSGTTGAVGSSGNTGGAGPTSGSTSSSSTSSSSTGGAGGGCVVEDCDDGVACTVDACSPSDACTHTADHEACGSSEYCDLADGCIAAPPCANVEDCELAWADDPCKVDLVCDAATALCGFSILDQDGDGYHPIGCGGDDCNDDDDDVSPTGFEWCDDEDQDCNPNVEGVDECGDDRTCVAHEEEGFTDYDCECIDESECPGVCGTVDFETDHDNCGDCDTTCPFNGTCSAGECTCDIASQTVCPFVDEKDRPILVCADLQNDWLHCGDCDTVCPGPNSTCVDGSCCSSDKSVCDGACVDLSFDQENCGDCGVVCDPEEECVFGDCELSSGVGQGGGS